jgi:DNA mismatch endonuclease Vsr
MTDIMSKAERSRLMAKIKCKDTGIERLLTGGLKRRRINGYRRNWKIIGKPDIAFPKEKVAVFCDGDFWHGYQFSRWRDKLSAFWKTKIGNNIKRDRKVRTALEEDGWKVLRFWGHEIKSNSSLCVSRIVKHVKR